MLIRRWRIVVLLVAVAIFVVKMIVAARTYGTNDIRHWYDFVQGVAQHGPVGIYAVHFRGSFYNHPPLIGYYLWFVNQLREQGLSIQFTIRTVSSAADVVSSLLVFEILRRRRGLALAGVAAGMVAVSPVLFVISGFHGNTDPIFCMLSLLALYLLADRDQPLLGGVALGLAIGIKIVPVVILPALMIYALMKGRATFVKALIGFGATFFVTWGPALLGQFHNVKSNVLGYMGSSLRQWGIEQVGHWAGNPAWVATVATSARMPLLILAAGVPAFLVWRRPEMVAEAVGAALCAFLFLSPAFGCQYLVWAVAASYLLGFGWANAYNISAGILLVFVYTRWNGGIPWNVAHASAFTPAETVDAFFVWQILGLGIFRGLVNAWRSPPHLTTPSAPPSGVGVSSRTGPPGERAEIGYRQDTNDQVPS
jgi:hypothetical protein